MSEISKELNMIKSIINKVGIFSRVQSESAKVSRQAKVSDGKHEEVDFDVVVRCAGSDFDKIKRRLSSIPNTEVETITENVLGVREKK